MIQYHEEESEEKTDVVVDYEWDDGTVRFVMMQPVQQGEDGIWIPESWFVPSE